MSRSDNGKAGELDFYDVCSVIEYIERKYDGTVQLNLSQAIAGGSTFMLLCASFVGNEPGNSRATGSSTEIPFSPNDLRRMPQVAFELLLHMQEVIDDQPQGEVRLSYYKP